MKHVISRALLSVLCLSGITTVQADIVATTESPTPTEYCIEQTSVRGSFDSLIIDHNLIIEPEDILKRGDVFVAARFKSKPGALWLLAGGRWNAIESNTELRNANYRHYDELPQVIPLSVFREPVDVSAVLGDGEVWIGYGLRSVGETAQDSFAEMTRNQRYSLLWEAPSSQDSPAHGINRRVICLEVIAVTNRTILMELPVEPVTSEAPPVGRAPL